MFTPNRFCIFRKESNCAFRSTHTRTSRGSRETEVKELAVMPCTLPGSRSTVTTVTPVAKLPITRRKSSGVREVVAMADVFQDITREILWRRRQIQRHPVGDWVRRQDAEIE